MLQVRNFEKVGLTRQQAEALTEHLTEVLCTHKEKLSEAMSQRHGWRRYEHHHTLRPGRLSVLEGLVIFMVKCSLNRKWTAAVLSCTDSSHMCVCLQSVLEGISRDAGFKSEVLKAQDMHHTTLNRESERLANDVSKVRAEIRWELWHWFMSDSRRRWRSLLLERCCPSRPRCDCGGQV